MTPTIVSNDQFWAAVEGHAPAPTPAANPPEPSDSYEAFAAAVEK